LPSRHATLSIESSDSFVAYAAASIATGWSEPVPGRDLHPLKSSAFSRRTVTPTARGVNSNALCGIPFWEAKRGLHVEFVYCRFHSDVE